MQVEVDRTQMNVLLRSVLSRVAECQLKLNDARERGDKTDTKYWKTQTAAARDTYAVILQVSEIEHEEFLYGQV